VVVPEKVLVRIVKEKNLNGKERVANGLNLGTETLEEDARITMTGAGKKTLQAYALGPKGRKKTIQILDFGNRYKPEKNK